MRALRKFGAACGGTTGAEFALILPVVLFFLLAMIDVGRFAWAINRAEKATQVGARWAVATAMVPHEIANYSFAVSGGVPQGTPVPTSAFHYATCLSNGSTVSCTCKTTGGDCSYYSSLSSDDILRFRDIVAQMKKMRPEIGEANVVVEYRNSGLGYSGDPNGPDIAPIINVRLRNQKFRPLSLLVFRVTSLNMPSSSYSLTMEDGQGTDAYY